MDLTPAFPIDVAIVCGTYADTSGNVSMDGEGLFAEALSAAQAARNSGGIVIAQVQHTVEHGRIDRRRVRIPGVLVDALVVDPLQRLSFATESDPSLTGEERSSVAAFPAMPMSARKVIARRAAMALRRGNIVNLGFGMPDGVAAVLAEEGLDRDHLHVEQGTSGVPQAVGCGLAADADATRRRQSVRLVRRGGWTLPS